MFKTIALFFICLAAHCLQAQDQSEIDSLEQQLNTDLADTTRALILDRLANMLPEGEWETYNDQMEKLVTEKLKHAQGRERTVFKNVLASAYNNKSLIYKYEGNIPKAVEYGEKSLAMFTELDDRRNMGTGYFNNGKLYYSLGDINRAVLSFENALKMTDDSDHKKLLPYCLNFLGFISKEQEDLEKAMEFHQRAYVAAQQLKDDEALAYTASCRALVLFELKRLAEARKNLSEALVVYQKIGDIQNQAAQYYHLGQVESESGRYPEAMKSYTEALSLYTIRDDKPGLTAVLNAIGRDYLKQGNTQMAEQYLAQSLTLAHGIGFPSYISAPAEGLYKIYRQKGQAQKALEMHELFVHMRDSVNNEAARKKILKAQYRYEFELKASADSIRTVGEKKVLHAQLAQEKTQRYGLMGGFVLLTMTAGFGFSHFRTRQRLKELKLRNQIASDLHDEVGSALSSISLFAGMARMKHGKETEDLVERIEQTSRDTISTMSDIVWSIAPDNDSFENVLNKMKQFGEQLTLPLSIAFTFHTDQSVKKLSLDMMQRKNIYLFYKESINNACKHARATTIAATLAKNGGALVMHLTDNGQGFDTGREYAGHGLGSLKARAADLAGNLEIRSTSGAGTSITLTVPLQARTAQVKKTITFDSTLP